MSRKRIPLSRWARAYRVVRVSLRSGSAWLLTCAWLFAQPLLSASDEGVDAVADDAHRPRQFAPPEAYLPGETLPYFGSEDPWEQRTPRIGNRVYEAQLILALADSRTEEALAAAEAWLAKDSTSNEARFCYALALGQAGRTDEAAQQVELLLDLGFPSGRFLAGPRVLVEPIRRLDVFAKRIVELDTGLLHGPMLGDIRPDSVKVWLRTSNESDIVVRLYEASNFDHDVAVGTTRTSAANDYTGVVELSGLVPATFYRYRIWIDGREAARTDEWNVRTTPPDDSSTPIRIAFGSCSDYEPDNEFIWDTIRLRRPAAFLTLGDNMYIDLPGPITPWHDHAYYRRQSRPEWRRLVAETPVYAIWDDHDLAIDDVFLGPFVDQPPWKREQFALFRR